MATLAKLLTERSTADTKHRQLLRRLGVVVGAQPPNRRTIVTTIAQAEQCYEDLVAVHIAYVQKLGATMDVQEHQNWIDTKGDAHMDAVAAATTAVELIDANPANAPPPRQLAMVTGERDHLVLRVNALHAAIEEALGGDARLNKEQHAAMTENFVALEGHLVRYGELIAEMKAVDAAQSATYQGQLNTFMTEKVPVVERIRVALAGARPAQQGAAGDNPQSLSWPLPEIHDGVGGSPVRDGQECGGMRCLPC